MTFNAKNEIAYLTGQMSGDAAPSGVCPGGHGAKFSPQGAVLSWPGNTILCHIDPASAQHAAITSMQADLQAGPLAEAYTFLPPASFHMTVFQGISNGKDWPQDVSKDVTLEAATDILAKRLDNIPVAQQFTVRPLGVFGGFGLRLIGATPQDEETLRATRRILRDATGIAPHGYETYAFHITLGYLLRWLTPHEAQDVIDLSEAVFARHAQDVQTIPLGPLEFCTFENMHHFKLVKWL